MTTIKFSNDEKQYLLNLAQNSSDKEIDDDMLFHERLLTKLREW